MSEPSETPAAGRPSRVVPVWIYPAVGLCAWATGLLLFLYFFNAVSTVLLGLLAAAIIACTLKPLLHYMPGPRGIEAAVLGLGLAAATIALFVLLSWPLAAPISNAIARWPHETASIDKSLQMWSVKIGLREPLHLESLLQNAASFLAGEGGQRLFSRSADVVLGVLISVALVLFGSIFLLGQPNDAIIGGMLDLVPTRQRKSVAAVLVDLEPRFRRWVWGTMLGMMIVFTASLVGYSIIGLDLALPLAMLAGLCEVVPTVGPATACAIAVLVTVATQSGGQTLGVVIVCATIQVFEAYLVLPLIMKGAVKIQPAVTLFTVVLWGKIFGLPGLILAMPINLTLWSILDNLIIRPRKEREGHRLPLHPGS